MPMCNQFSNTSNTLISTANQSPSASSVPSTIIVFYYQIGKASSGHLYVNCSGNCPKYAASNSKLYMQKGTKRSTIPKGG